MTETTHEHKAPAKKRATRKKMQTVINVARLGLQHSRSYNESQLKALEKKIERRLRTVALQKTEKV
jgi:hypothetical protein